MNYRVHLVCALLCDPLAQLWNYIYFVIYLRDVHRSNMNGLETRIARMVIDAADPDLSWMDVHKLSPWCVPSW